jgi:hypothetical protein
LQTSPEAKNSDFLIVLANTKLETRLLTAAKNKNLLLVRIAG